MDNLLLLLQMIFLKIIIFKKKYCLLIFFNIFINDVLFALYYLSKKWLFIYFGFKILFFETPIAINSNIIIKTF